MMGDTAMDSALRLAIHVRRVESDLVVLNMIRRIFRATDLDEAGKVRQIRRVIAALERIYAEVSE